MAEPSVDPGYLLRALRTFVRAAVDSNVTEEGGDGQGALGFEEAGCLVWDCAALEEDAAFLLQHGVQEMLMPFLTAVAARAASEVAAGAAHSAQRQWRALEIGLGILGNLACHPGAKRTLLQQQGLEELLLSRLLWVDDAASLAELCRCLAALMGESGEVGQDHSTVGPLPAAPPGRHGMWVHGWSP